MSRRVVVLGLALATALLMTTAAQRAAPAPPTARAAACDALGVAGSFAVFAHQDFNAAKTGGGSIAGRIAAGDDVTLGITTSPAAGDASPTVIAGRDFIGAGQDKLTGNVLYGRNFQPGIYEVTGGGQQGAPSFSFDEQFQRLALLSDAWSKESQTPGASAALESGAFVFHGFTTGPNVFNITAAALQPAAGIRISLDRGPQAGTNAAPSVLINVSGTIPITFAPGTPQYMDLGTVSPRRLIWNLPQVTALKVNHQIGWKGLILAPNASISGPQGAQLDGQMIAKDVPSAEWTISRGQLEICPPGPTPPEPDTSLELEALCVDPFGNLAMRVANRGDRDRAVHWDDLGPGKEDFGDFEAQKGRYQYFNVRDGDAGSRIRMIADPESAEPVRFAAVRGTDQRCGGKITITKQVFGTAAPPGPWTVELTGVDPRGGGVQTTTRELGGGESVELHALGGYQPGSAEFGDVVGGIAYTISEPDPPGDAIVEISANPVHILGYSDPEHEQNEPVTISNTYPDTPEGGGGGPEPPIDPVQPTLPPGAPDPPPGPDLVGGTPGGAYPDLVVTHTITPRRVRVGDTIQTVTRVRNAGAVPASGAVLRDLPQYRALEANNVARVLSVSTSAGRCTRRRPVRCAPGHARPRRRGRGPQPHQAAARGGPPERGPRLVADSRVQHHQQPRPGAGVGRAAHSAPARGDQRAAVRPGRRTTRLPGERDRHRQARCGARAAVRAAGGDADRGSREGDVRLPRRALPRHPGAPARPHRLVRGVRRPGCRRAPAPDRGSDGRRPGPRAPSDRAGADRRPGGVRLSAPPTALLIARPCRRRSPRSRRSPARLARGRVGEDVAHVAGAVARRSTRAPAPPAGRRQRARHLADGARRARCRR